LYIWTLEVWKLYARFCIGYNLREMNEQRKSREGKTDRALIPSLRLTHLSPWVA